VSSVVKSFRAVSAYRQRKKTAWIREEFNPFGVLAVGGDLGSMQVESVGFSFTPAARKDLFLSCPITAPAAVTMMTKDRITVSAGHRGTRKI
jgi:hypothetical protein